LEYAAQVRWKSEQVRRQLQRIGHFAAPPVRPTIPAPQPWNYRNQARFSLDVRGRLGFTHFQSRRLLPIDFCLIMQPEIVALMPRLQGALPGGHQVVVRYGAQTGQVMVAPRLDLPDLETGQPSYDERLLGRTYRVSAPSFFQVNTRVDPFERPIGEESPPLDRPRYPRADTWATWSDATLRHVSQAELLALLVLDRLPLTGRELVVDAYCGVGTFALPIAERAGRVIGIEEAPSAVADARHNARGLDHVEFLVGRTEALLGSLGERPDAVVLDPARVGCAPEVLAALAELRPATLVYVSCDPATLARDLARLVASGFELVDVQPIDMFPQTHHIETVSVLRG
jgi:23S rRNA (uracil1939-C5)-methyltransferase